MRHPVEVLWREVGLPEYFLGNDGSNHKLYELHARIVEQCARISESYYSGAEAADHIRVLSSHDRA